MLSSETSVHAVPFQDSLLSTEPGLPPPKINPAVTVPAPPGFCALPVLISAISVQDEPLYCSTLSLVPGSPPAPIAAVYIPKLPKEYLFVFISFPGADQDVPS